MDMVQSNARIIQFMSSAGAANMEENLLAINYTRAQQNSPEFTTKYESIEQHISITISTFVFKVAPEPVLALYDFIMSTFVGKSGTESHHPQIVEPRAETIDSGANDGGIRVAIQLASVRGQYVFVIMIYIPADSQS
jgi:vacuolar protein sorting-associated protein 13A/C